ncbi:methylenetetrahydrofolate reductase [Actinophytocola sp.]|uniref:methylenetetrahydrofolate reductase n=1 Tax=Actinophytocola sp. TaxID=1872138 RepID=UPI003D6A41AD
MRNTGWLRSVRYEVIPTKSIADRVLESVPTDVAVTITASPTKGLDPTLDLAERLAAHGYRVVPHLTARLVVDDVHLKEIVDRLLRAGVDDVFVPAGDADPPVGRYDGALPLLVDLTRLGRPFAHVGITGYPQSHPAIDDDIAVQAMWDKRAFATYIVSNLCFDAKALASWVRRVRRRGVDLPIQLGLAGPVERTKLLAMAGKVGVAESARFLGKHLIWFARLATAYSPERLLDRVGDELSTPDAGIAGLHLFTFNQVAETQMWRTRLLS